MPSTPLPSPAASPALPESAHPSAPADMAVSLDAAPTEQTPAAPALATPPSSLSPMECATELKRRFPALFSGGPKPLKLRIQADIQERAPGVFSKQVLSAYLRRHTGSTSYLIATTRAKTRFDLDGQAAGELSDEHRQIAQQELNRRREIQQARVEQEETERRNRAGLLRDFERTTLTVANFCALKGIAVEHIDGLLALARQDAASPPPVPPHDDRLRGHRPHPRGEHQGRNDRPREERPRNGRPQGDRTQGQRPAQAGRHDPAPHRSGRARTPDHSPVQPAPQADAALAVNATDAGANGAVHVHSDTHSDTSSSAE